MSHPAASLASFQKYDSEPAMLLRPALTHFRFKAIARGVSHFELLQWLRLASMGRKTTPTSSFRRRVIGFVSICIASKSAPTRRLRVDGFPCGKKQKAAQGT